MKHIIQKKNALENIDVVFWDYLDDINSSERKETSNIYTYLGYRSYNDSDKKVETILSEWNITSAYVMHYRGTSKFQWNSPVFIDSQNQFFMKAQKYLVKYNLIGYHGIIFLENFSEIKEFIIAMAHYPMIAHYQNFYLFCNNSIIFEIGHHDDIFIFKKI